MKRIVLLAFAWIGLSSAALAQTPAQVVPGTTASTGCLSPNLTPCFVAYGPANPLNTGPGSYGLATPITASTVGTTNATTATLAAVAGKTTYLCGFSIRADATAAATGNATVTGTVTGTLNFTQWTAPLASGIGILEPPLGPFCIAASAPNTAIVVNSAAPGSGGTVTVSAWGYQL